MGVIAGILAILYPKHAIILSSALYGAVISSKILLDMFRPQTEILYFYFVAFIVFLTGAFIQLKSNGLSFRIYTAKDYKMLAPNSKTIRNEVDENGQEYSPKYVKPSSQEGSVKSDQGIQKRI